jgi:hypothetical protein
MHLGGKIVLDLGNRDLDTLVMFGIIGLMMGLVILKVFN